MMKRALDVAGINQASVFPDLDGLARYLAWKYKRDRLPSDEGWQAESRKVSRAKRSTQNHPTKE